MQAHCPEELLLKRRCLWEIIQAVWQWIPELFEHKAACFVPSEAFGAYVLSHQVPLHALWRVHRLDAFEVSVDLLSQVYLHPKKAPATTLKHLPA